MSVHSNFGHPLDHPIWTALTTTQRALAEGDGRARRYPTDVTPFADMPDLSPANFAALGALMSPTDTFVPPSDTDIFFWGRPESPVSGTPDARTVLGAQGGGGVVGSYGHIIK